jgi:lipopolysaccharide biosynthesis regulator YciM
LIVPSTSPSISNSLRNLTELFNRNALREKTARSGRCQRSVGLLRNDRRARRAHRLACWGCGFALAVKHRHCVTASVWAASNADVVPRGSH